MKIIKDNKKSWLLWAILLNVLIITSSSCESPPKIFTIGIATYDSDIRGPELQLDGFKNGMSNLGYIKGENIRYIYEFIPMDYMYDIQLIGLKLKELLSQDLDLLLVIGKELSSQAKKLVEGTSMPVIFGGTPWPVKEGLVDSLRHPGGNLTGVKFVDTIPKALEWLVLISGTKKVYVPYNPKEDVSIASLDSMDKIANQLGIELVLHEIYSIEEAAVAIKNLPEDVNAVFHIPSPLLDPRSSDLSRAAIERGMVMSSPVQLDETVLATFTNDDYNIGEKLAHLAQQIEQGVRPSDLPVETAEVFLTINLRTAEKIGLYLPDSILAQANKIIR